MIVVLNPDVIALLERYAALRGDPADGIAANAILAAALHELLPRAERIAAARRAADEHRIHVDHG